MSRLSKATQGVRPALKARMSISGPQGSGKTLTLMEIAEILSPGGKHLVIDTEKKSALTYADVYTFKHLPWDAPFDPRELGATLREAGDQYDTVIVDSLSHFWFGDGGTLAIADGKFGGWKVARPAQEDLVAGILDADAHVLIGVRSKVEFAQELENGRVVVKKLGMADRQDDTLGYELNVTADMNMEHQLTISKSRTVAVPVGRTFQPGHAEDFARVYGEWLAGGEPPLTTEAMFALKAELGALDQYQTLWARAEWNERSLPPLMSVRESQLADVKALIADALKVSQPPAGDRNGEEEATPAAA
jgi:AAA domain-containing protein